MIALNLKKSLVWVTTLITIILCVLIVVGVRQYRLHHHYGQVIAQSEKLLFHFNLVRENITHSLLDKNFASLAEAGQQIESLHILLRNILEDQHIADEYKLIFINQVDLPGLTNLLSSGAAPPLQQEQRAEITRRIRELGDQIALFNRVVANHAKSTLVNFQTIVIGSLALVLFVVINILVLWHRQVGMPLLSLARQLKELAAGRLEEFTMPNGAAELSQLGVSLKHLLRNRRQQVREFLAEPPGVDETAPATSRQAAMAQQLAHNAGQVSLVVSALAADVERYAQVMAASFREKNNGTDHEKLSKKIMLEGQRIASIILEQGNGIAVIVEQLTSSHE